MKIAIDISQIAYGTGVSVYTENLVRTLVKNYPDIHWVLFAGVFRNKKNIENFTNDLNVETVVKLFPPKVANIVWNRLHVFPIERWVGGVDLIHTSDWAEPPSKIPKVTTIHDLVPILFPETSTKLIRDAHERKLHWVRRESEKILAVSHSTKKDIVECLNIPANKIEVTYEGVDPIYYPQSETEIKRVQHKYQINGDYVFSLSTVEPRKNFKRLIEYYKMVLRKLPKLKLVIAGKVGWGELPELSKNIIFLGYVPTEDLPALYSGALCYALPSFYEGFGLSQLQAMSCGTPVVSSNVSSIPEVVGSAGILVNPNETDKIAEGVVLAIRNRKELVEKGLKQAKKFSWDAVARITFESYMSVLHTGKSI